MFRNDVQRTMVCTILTYRIRSVSLWTDRGPTPLAQKLLRASISTHELTMLHFAWAIWNGRAMVKRPAGVDALVDGLDAVNLRMVGSLLVAMAGSATDIDRWVIDRLKELGAHEPTSDHANREGGLDW